MTMDTRQRILSTTEDLLRRQGYHGTGLKQIVAEARAPFGSIYHHFPGGKEQLGAEAIRAAGATYALLLPLVLGAAPDLVTGIRDFFRLAAVHLEDSGWTDACPIATVALEVASESEPLRQATHEVFESWIEDATRWMVNEDLDESVARRLSISLVCALEGGFVLARAGRSQTPLLVAGDLVADAVEAVVSQG